MSWTWNWKEFSYALNDSKQDNLEIVQNGSELKPVARMRLAPLKNLGEELFPMELGGVLEYDVICLLANIEFSAERMELSHKILVASKADHTISISTESTKIRTETKFLLNCRVFEFMISYACFRT